MGKKCSDPETFPPLRLPASLFAVMQVIQIISVNLNQLIGLTVFSHGEQSSIKKIEQFKKVLFCFVFSFFLLKSFSTEISQVSPEI